MDPKSVSSGCRVVRPAEAGSILPLLILLLALAAPDSVSAAVRISEVMTSNSRTLADEDGDYPDWIELFNDSFEAVELGGWGVTDDRSVLNKWTLPPVRLGAQEFLVIFASGKNRAVTGQPLHTRFRLGSGGVDFLGLVGPDGITLVDSIGNIPALPPDVSFGIAQTLTTTPLLQPASAGRVWVPTDGPPAGAWELPGYDDAAWVASTASVGFETLAPGFAVRWVKARGAVETLAQAESLLGDERLQSEALFENRPVVNYRVTGPTGHYATDAAFPGSASIASRDNFALEARSWVEIPQAGEWTFGVNSDAGFRLTIGDFTSAFPGLRAAADTLATFNFPSAGLYALRLVMFESTGGEAVELFAAPGARSVWDGSVFRLVGDTASGGLAARSIPARAPALLSLRDVLLTDLESRMAGKSTTAYLRLPFQLTPGEDARSVQLMARYDDGLVVWLNGHRVASRLAPADPAWNSTAAFPRPLTDVLRPDRINLSDFASLLQPGRNVLAIQGFNSSLSDPRFLLSVALEAVHASGDQRLPLATATPGSFNDHEPFLRVPEVGFSRTRGFQDAPFDLVLSNALAGAAIRYTLDGTDPSAPQARGYEGPIRVEGTTVVRAVALKEGYLASAPTAHTFLFTSDIIRQSPERQIALGWPVPPGSPALDYGMDPKVVDDPRYAASIQEDLKSIPTLSFVMDLKDLFDTSRGIYANPHEEGKAWERPMSMELIQPDGTPGFQIQAGLRIRGGFSRDAGNPKHSFRIFFSPEYGASRLAFPMFGPEGASGYDKFDLRCAQNSSWHLTGDASAIFMRDVFSRDTQLATGSASTHGDFYHLYINGQYWGLYNTEERPEAAFAAGYFGGRTEDYDVIKIEVNPGNVVAIDGNLTAWSNLWARAEAGLSSDASYQRIQGNWPDGSRNPDYPILLDVPNLIDYMLVNIFAGNRDGPSVPNNFYCIRNRNGTAGFRFICHDSEQTLMDVNEDQTLPNSVGSEFLKSNPARLWQQCLANAEFRMLAADHVQRHFFNGGVFSVEATTARLQRRADEIRRAVVAESARWGDFRNPTTPFTRDGDWATAVSSILQNYLPKRPAVVLKQLKTLGLRPDLPAPAIAPPGGRIQPGASVSITAAAAGPIVLYTLDGSDPRQAGGAISPSARAYEDPFPLLASTLVKARAKSGADWSPLVEARFVVDQDLSRLVVSEIHYNPAGIGDVLGDEFEFLELQNTGPEPLDLAGYQFTTGVLFTFPPGTSIPPDGFFVLARNPDRIAQRYPGVRVDGVYSGRLDNGGETLTLNHPLGSVIWSLTYDDEQGWPRTSDGLGFSLVRRPGNGDPGNPSSWRASARAGGSPGAADPESSFPDVVISELRAASVAPQRDSVELHNRGPIPAPVGGWYLSDELVVPKKYRIPVGTVIPAGGFLVVDDRQFDAPGGGTRFGLSSKGETVFLLSAGADGELTGYSHAFDYRASPAGDSMIRVVTSDLQEHVVAASAVTLGTSNAPPRLGPVVFSEIHYHPSPGFDEFIEIQNLTSSPLLLQSTDPSPEPWRIAGLGFTFPPGTTLPASGRLLVTGIDPQVFRTRYEVPQGVPILGPFSGTLQNSGERLELQRPGPLDGSTRIYYRVDSVRYNDRQPWPVAADGDGPSLQRREGAGFGEEPLEWFASGLTPGRPNTTNAPPQIQWITPGADDPRVAPADVWLEVGVTDDSGPIRRVEYFANGRQLGETTQVPHRFLWRNADGGLNELLAQATDAGYALGRSTPRLLRVNPAPDSDGTGLAGEYFDNNNFTALKAVRLDPGVNFRWGTGAPAPGVGPDTFSVRWSGQLKPQVTGNHAFHTLSDEAVRLWVDGRLLIDNWVRHEEIENSGSIALMAGERYDIRIDYLDEFKDATIWLGWTAPGIARQTVPASQLYPSRKTTPGPVILSHPISQQVVAGTALNLTVYAQGAGTLNYEWRRNGILLPEFNGPTLAVAKAGAEHAGDYRVRVSNTEGEDWSLPATVTVVLKPELIYLSPPTAFVVGDELRLEATATGTPPLNYRWRVGPKFFVPSSNGVLRIPVTKATDAGNYSVTITNLTGVRITSPNVAVSVAPDLDGDRLPDAWEKQFGLPAGAGGDGAGDPDQDGSDNRSEYLAGTDPKDPSSVLLITGWTATEAGLTLRFNAVSNHSYGILFTPSLTTGVWEQRAQVSPGPTNRSETVSGLPLAPVGGFYRLVTPPF